jgi:hypothetical protein
MPNGSRFRVQAFRPWSVLALCLGVAEFLGGLAVLGYIAHVYGSTPDWGQDEIWATVYLGFPLVGGVTASLRPRHPVGWLLLLIGALGLTSQFCFAYSPGPHISLPQALVLAAAGYTLYASLALIAILLLIFPTGSLGQGRRRRLVFAAVALVVVGPIPSCLTRELSGDAANYVNPFSPHGLQTLIGISGDVALLLALVLVVATATDAVIRLRRSRGVPRQQLKWLTFAAAFLVPGLAVGVAIPTWWSAIPLALATNSLAASIGLSIVRYHLYDIDRLISRTLSYAVVTGLLIGVYVGLVALATKVLPFSSPLGVAVSTLAAAALFYPLRGQVQRLVDRRFNRARYDAEATVSAFAQRVRDDVDLELVSSEFVRAVRTSVEPNHISLWLRPSDSSH